MYGKSRFTKGRSTNRASGATRMRASTAYKKVGNSFSKSRSVVGQRLARREIKFDDDYYSLQAWTQTNFQGDATASGFLNWVLGGIISRGNYRPGGASSTVSGGGEVGYIPQVTYAPNCLTNVDSGTTAKTRIGNLIQPRYLNVKGVLNAAMTVAPGDGETTFRSETGTEELTMVRRYLRTSIRIYIIRDKSMNEKGYVTYDDVFESPGEVGWGSGAGINPFLWNRKVDTISRYQILKTMEYELDQDDPQQAFNCNIPLNGIAIRYNGASTAKVDVSQAVQWQAQAGGTVPGTSVYATVAQGFEAQSMTNGIYLLAVAHNGVQVWPTGGGASFSSPSLVFSSRLTFED